MSDLPPQLIQSYDGAPVGSGTEATAEREKRREAERDALVSDTHQREAALLEDTQQLFTHLSAYLRGELSSMCCSKHNSERLLYSLEDRHFHPHILYSSVSDLFFGSHNG